MPRTKTIKASEIEWEVVDKYEALESKLRAVLDSHHPDIQPDDLGTIPWCVQCGCIWPCSTVRIIQGDTDD